MVGSKMKKFLPALQFLTIIPVKVTGEVTEKDIAGSTTFFPLVGAIQGLLITGGAVLFTKLFNTEIASGVAILILTVSNGGFHLDGLADTFDALAVKSSGDREEDLAKRLSVMKDSSTGAIGVVAIVFTVLLKFALIKALLSHSSLLTLDSSLILILMPAFSKWVTVPAMYHGVSARKDGLGRILLDNVGINEVLSSTVFMILLCLPAIFMGRWFPFGSPWPFFLVVLVMLYFFSLLTVRFCKARFGGLTGDTFGAMGELSEILYLMTALLMIR